MPGMTLSWGRSLSWRARSTASMGAVSDVSGWRRWQGAKVTVRNDVAITYDELGASTRLKRALDHMDEALQRAEESSERRSTAFAASVEAQVIEVVRPPDEE